MNQNAATNSRNQSYGEMRRRSFLGTLSAGAAAIGLSLLTPSTLKATANTTSNFRDPGDPEKWFDKLKGKHRIVFDVPEPFESPLLPFVWPRVFLMTNAATGTPEKECGVVMILRHDAIPYALNNSIWEKYPLGQVFKINDPATNSPQTKNPFWQPAPGTYMAPGVGEVAIGINELQESGVMFCVCNAALTVFSNAVAGKMNLKGDDVYKEWVAGVLPGIQIVPSGVWAVNRAQEHGCSYCH